MSNRRKATKSPQGLRRRRGRFVVGMPGGGGTVGETGAGAGVGVGVGVDEGAAVTPASEEEGVNTGASAEPPPNACSAIRCDSSADVWKVVSSWSSSAIAGEPNPAAGEPSDLVPSFPA